MDETGSANISLTTGLVIARQGRDEQKVSTTAQHWTQQHWTQTMLAASEAALAGVPPTVAAIETATGMSRGAAFNALARMEQLGLLARSEGKRGPKSARRIVNVDSLIDQYASAAEPFRIKQPVLLLHRLWNDPLAGFTKDIAPTLSREGVLWAVTGAAASTLLAPYLSDVTIVELYLDDDLFSDVARISRLLGGRAVDRGHRLEVRALPTSMSAAGPDVGGVRVALPARVYADLIAVGGRSGEAAHHLRETVNVGPSS